MKRTTIVLEPLLEQRLKKCARTQDTSVTTLINTFIREGLNHTMEKRVRNAPIKLPSFDMGTSFVDPADRDRLWDLFEES